MKDPSELNFPADVRYTTDHEWARAEAGMVRIGITDYAQDQLGDIVFVDLPDVGRSFQKGREFGAVESVKAVSELYMPLGGEVTSVNRSLENEPDRVNTSPYQDGWMIVVKPDDPSEMGTLMDCNAYCDMLKGK